MKMITAKTAELQGAALDWAVAMAEGWEPDRPQDGQVKKEGLPYLVCGMKPNPCNPASRYAFNPSTDWAQGGPLIEECLVCLDHFRPEWGDAFSIAWIQDRPIPSKSRGPTPLIAAMRALVAAKLGDEVQVPAELMEAPGR